MGTRLGFEYHTNTKQIETNYLQELGFGIWSFLWGNTER
jgi:hypothetical protein